VLPVIAAT